MVKKETMDEKEQARLVWEIDILKNLDHPNIVKVFEFFDDS